MRMAHIQIESVKRLMIIFQKIKSFPQRKRIKYLSDPEKYVGKYM